MVPSPGSIIAGKFRLERPLAQGGMGSVWVAHNQQLDVPVAVKFMAASLVGSTDLVARFEREAKAAAQLRHPNVVQVFEHGVHEGLPFIVMELLEGESLGIRLKARRRLTLAETSRILGEVCLALRRAHERGLVHRDLKPANIFLCRHDDLEVVKVLDFGIAKTMSPSANEEVTKTGAIFGSPHYMSPEQARRTNRPVDHRSDLWALGVIAYRCTVGQLPFPGDDAIDVLVRMCTDDAPAPSSIAPDLGPEVDRFFTRAIARDPDGRFQSAREFAEALAALAEQPGRMSMPPLQSAAPGAVKPPSAVTAAGGEDVSDGMATVPLSDPAVQRAVGPWAGAASSSQPDPATAGTPVGLATGASRAGAWGPAPPAAPSASISSPAGLMEPTPAGTLTSAGAELGPYAAPRGRKPWVVPAAVAGALAVIGLAAGVWAVSGDPAQDSPGGAPATPAAASGASTAAPSLNTASPPALSTSVLSLPAPPPRAEAEPSLTASAAPAPAVTATAKGAAKQASPGAQVAPTATATSKAGGSGYLGKPKF